MSNEITLSHAKKLRFLRKLNDKKQLEIALAIDISQQAYSKLENGETNFSDEVIEKIANFFSITPAEFEKPLDNIYIGNNSSFAGSNNISTIDVQLLETLKEMYAKNEELYQLLLSEKDNMIATLKNK